MRLSGSAPDYYLKKSSTDIENLSFLLYDIRKIFKAGGCHMTIRPSMCGRSDRKKNYRFKPDSISYSLSESFIGSVFYFIFSFLFSTIPFIPVENSCTLIHSFIHEHIPLSNLYIFFQNHYPCGLRTKRALILESLFPRITSQTDDSAKNHHLLPISFRICLKYPALYMDTLGRSVDDLHISLNTFTS